MSSRGELEQILSKASKDLIDDIENVLKCDAIREEMKKYYLTDIQPFLKKHSNILGISSKRKKREKLQRIKDLFRGAEFYNAKAREYFGFFGIDFDDPSKSQPIQIPNMNEEQLLHFLYSSIQLLYVVLWEIFRDFLEPLEGMYYLRLCHSGAFPPIYDMFPASVDVEKIELASFDIIKRARPLFRVSESLPFELRLILQVSSYFKGCFEKVAQAIEVDSSEEIVDDFIRLFIVRNNVCHIGRAHIIQQVSESKTQKMLYRMTTHLPRIQNSCIGITLLFKELASEEPARN